MKGGVDPDGDSTTGGGGVFPDGDSTTGASGVLPDDVDSTTGGGGVLPDEGDDDDDDDDHHEHGSMPDDVDAVNELGEERVSDAMTAGLLDGYQRTSKPLSGADKMVRLSLAAAVLAFSGVVFLLSKQQTRVHVVDERGQLQLI